MSARFDAEVMEHLNKLHRQSLRGQPARLSGAASARLSLGESAAFASPGQNPSAVFHENFPAQQSGEGSNDSDPTLRKPSDDETEDFTNEKILQPRRLSLRVF